MALCKGGVRSFERPRAAAGIGPGGRGEACGKLGSEHEVCAAKTKPRDPGLPWGCSDNRGFEPFPKQSCDGRILYVIPEALLNMEQLLLNENLLKLETASAETWGSGSQSLVSSFI